MNVLEETNKFHQQQREKIKAEIKVARQAVQAAAKDLADRQSALEALIATQETLDGFIKGFKNGGKKSTSKQPAGKSEAGSGNVNQQHVLIACRQVVSDNPGIEMGELEVFVKSKLKEETELGLRGYDKRFKEVMNKEEFRVDERDCVWLQEGSHTNHSMVAVRTNNGSEMDVDSSTNQPKRD